MAVSESLGDRRNVEVAAGPIEYREAGDGDPPVVFVHGPMANGDLWRDVVPRLAGRHRCITPDLPHGSHSLPMNEDADLTPAGLARLIADFLETLELTDVTLVANDYGGALSQVVMADHPERLGRVLLTSCDSFGQLPPRLLKPLPLVARIPAALPWMVRMGKRRRVQRAFYAGLAHRRIEPEILESYLAPAQRDERIVRDLRKLCMALAPRYTHDAARKLPGFDRPVLVAWGSHDPWFARRNGRRLAELLPQGRFTLVEGAMTFVPEDAPERVAKLVEELVSERVPVAA
jgi:pimeloyl-ACP methyl ester carboxylesterase